MTDMPKTLEEEVKSSFANQDHNDSSDFKSDAVSQFDDLERRLIQERFQSLLLDAGFSPEDSQSISHTNPKHITPGLNSAERTQENRIRNIYNKAKHDVRSARNTVGGIEKNLSLDAE